MFRFVESKMNVNTVDLKGISSMKSLLEGTSYKAEESSISLSSKIFKDDEDDSTDFSFIKDRKSQNKIF
jgi:hypothetical protein